MAKKLDDENSWDGLEPADSSESDREPQPPPDHAGILRESRLERAKRLVQDPNYPSDEMLQTLADMLARHWYSY